MMSAQVIPRSQWTEFAAWFTRRHPRALTSAFWRESTGPLQLLVQNGLFGRLSVRLESTVDHATIEFARDLRQLIPHRLVGLSGIRFLMKEDEERLELESKNGAVLSLRVLETRRQDREGVLYVEPSETF